MARRLIRPAEKLIDNPAVERFDRRLTGAAAAAGLPLLRLALGVIYLWFGALKLLPGLSPAEDIAGRTIHDLSLGLVPAGGGVLLVGVLEVVIGLGFVSGLFMRLTIALFAFQMVGALSPLLLYPTETWHIFPIAPTLEGQYIIKNAVLIAAAVVLGATVRGGRLVAEPTATAAGQPPPD